MNTESSEGVYKNTGFTTSVLTIFVTAGGILAVLVKNKSLLITVNTKLAFYRSHLSSSLVQLLKLSSLLSVLESSIQTLTLLETQAVSLWSLFNLSLDFSR